MKTRTTDQVRFAGVSIQATPEGKNPKLNFHTSGGDSRMGIWFDPPGFSQCLFIPVPKGMNKIEGARFLIGHELFQNDAIKEFLERKIIRMIAATSEDAFSDNGSLTSLISGSLFGVGGKMVQAQRRMKTAA